MIKRILCVFLLIFSFLDSINIYAYGDNTYDIYSDSITIMTDDESNVINVKSLVSNDIIMIPIRQVYEALGLEVSWDNTTKTVTAIAENLYIELKIDSKMAVINGVEIELQAAACLQNGQAIMPLDFIADSTGFCVTEDEKTKAISIIQPLENDYNNFEKVVDKQKVVVLMYHHILKDGENRLYKKNSATNSYESFEEQINYIHIEGFNTITCEQLEQFLYAKKPLPPSKNGKSVLITFDDGYLSNYIYAYPMLKQYNMKATIFHVTVNSSKENIECMNPDKLERFSIDQMTNTLDVFGHQMHTHNAHGKVDGVEELLKLSDEEIKLDLSKNKENLPSVSAVKYFAYPYGMYNDNIIKVLNNFGVKLAFTVKHGYVNSSSNPYELERYAVFPWIKMDKFKRIINGK